jgi:hypothetical protein
MRMVPREVGGYLEWAAGGNWLAITGLAFGAFMFYLRGSSDFWARFRLDRGV